MANTKAALELEKIDNNETNEVYTLDEIRSRKRINIYLPDTSDSSEDPDHLEQYEYVIINGKTTQIKKGEVVAVSWEIYEALKNSDAYRKLNILR